MFCSVLFYVRIIMFTFFKKKQSTYDYSWSVSGTSQVGCNFKLASLFFDGRSLSQVAFINSSHITGFGVLGLVGLYPVYERSVISVGVTAACSVP